MSEQTDVQARVEEGYNPGHNNNNRKQRSRILCKSSPVIIILLLCLVSLLFGYILHDTIDNYQQCHPLWSKTLQSKCSLPDKQANDIFTKGNEGYRFKQEYMSFCCHGLSNTQDVRRRPRSTGFDDTKEITGCFLYLDTSRKKGTSLKWTHSYAGGFTFISGKMELINGTKVKIGEAGYYYVFSSFQFDAYTWDPEEENQTIQHNLVRDPGGDVIKYNRVTIKKGYFVPSQINMLVYLQKGDMIYVNVNDPQYVYYQPETNFLGLYKR